MTIIILLSILPLTLLLGMLSQLIIERKVNNYTRHDPRYFKLNGININTQITDKSKPTVVLEAGAGDCHVFSRVSDKIDFVILESVQS